MPNPVIDLAIEVDGDAAAKEAEAWARGQRGGVDVGTSDPTYHNNAKYYAEILQAAYDESGVSQITVDGIKGANIVRKGRCNLPASRAAKTVTIEGFVLMEGARITVEFYTKNTATSDVTLNVNDTGAYPIVSGGVAINEYTAHKLYGYVDLVFNGTLWYIVGGDEEIPERAIYDYMSTSLRPAPPTTTAVAAYVQSKVSGVDVTAGAGLSLSTERELGHSNSVEAGTIGETGASSGAVVSVPYATFDAQGHITGKGVRNHTIPAMGGATASAAGTAGLVPAPASGYNGRFLRGDGTWAAITPSSLGVKPVQTAVADPAASGTGVTFIDTISQNENGVITPHKRTVRTMGAATSSAAGTTGLVPAPAAGSQGRFLRGDGTWQELSLSSLGAKPLQTAKSSPGASGNATAYIDTISQAADGVITATKKTIPTWAGATASAAGTAGLLPAPAAANYLKFLRGDGAWCDPNCYGKCTTAAATAAKAVTIAGFTLAVGAIVTIWFTKSNTAADPTLNVSGTGAYPIVTWGTTAVGTTAAASWRANSAVQMLYNGTSWVMIGYANDNDNTIPGAYCATAAGTAAKTATMTGYTLQANSHVPVYFANGSTVASSTLNINGTGAKPIYVSSGGAYARTTFAKGWYVAWYNGTNYYIRTDGSLPGPAAYSHETFTVTIPAGDASYTLSDSRFTADSRCDSHSLAAVGCATSVAWSFGSGSCTFTLGAALSAALTFQFSVIF